MSEKYLYYYTKVKTMRSILENRNIYATNLIYMNDSEEYLNGLREVADMLNERTKEEKVDDTKIKDLREKADFYSISFSTAEDLLSQWTMYAGESGVRIKMSFDGNEKYKGWEATDDKDNKRVVINEEFQIAPREVHYCTKKKMCGEIYQDMQKSIWSNMREQENPVTRNAFEMNQEYYLRKMAPYVKRYEFSAEEEYRLVFDWRIIPPKLRIDYRLDKGVLKPYLDIECEGGWPIREIMVGPGFNQDVVFNSIVHFLNNRLIVTKKFDDDIDMKENSVKTKCGIVVSKSSIPYIF